MPMSATRWRGPCSRANRPARPPQAWLARIGEYMALKLKADAAYSAALAHNPMSRAGRGRYRTDWLREAPYSLAELAAFVPKGWRRPIAQPRTVYGRNDALFREGMRWSGKPRNWGKWAALEDAPLGDERGFYRATRCAGAGWDSQEHNPLPAAQPGERAAARDVCIRIQAEPWAGRVGRLRYEGSNEQRKTVGS